MEVMTRDKRARAGWLLFGEELKIQPDENGSRLSSPAWRLVPQTRNSVQPSVAFDWIFCQRDKSAVKVYFRFLSQLSAA